MNQPAGDDTRTDWCGVAGDSTDPHVARAKGWMAELWNSRAAGVLLALGLYLGAITIPSERSLAGGVARLAFCPGLGGSYCKRYVPVLVWRDPDGSLQSGLYYDDGVRERVRALPSPRRDGVAQGIHFGPTRKDLAIWAPLWKITSHRFVGLDTSAPMSATESAAYRGAMFDTLNAAGYGPLPPGLRTADLSISTFSPLGLVSNIWGILCASGLVVWYRPVNRLHRRRAAAAAAWRRQHGECIHCGYSRAGLQVPRCPECGNFLP